MKNYKKNIIVYSNIIVGSITLLIEPKIIRNFSYVAHIEDLIIHKNFRNIKLAHKLINHCIHDIKDNIYFNLFTTKCLVMDTDIYTIDYKYLAKMRLLIKNRWNIIYQFYQENKYCKY